MSDNLYKRLFEHPIMVEHLVHGFLPDLLAAGVDFAGMEPVPTSFQGEGWRRDGDCIWRLALSDGREAYLYLMLEFQSRPDRWMAVRILVYCGMLWQHVIDTHKLGAGSLLPPVLPVVLYNGLRPWRAPVELGRLIALPQKSGLWRWQPRLRYILLDERELVRRHPVVHENLASLLFRLEQSRDGKELAAIGQAAAEWFLRHPGRRGLERLFAEVMRGSAKRVAPDTALAEPPDSMMESVVTLAENMELWVRRETRKARKEGRAEGREEGRAEGREEGRAEGREEGRAEQLIEMLQGRFGVLPPEIEGRVRNAGTEQLALFARRLLRADRLDDVFADR